MAQAHHSHTSKEEKARLYGKALTINTSVWFVQLIAIFVFSAGSLALLGDWGHGGADILILAGTYWLLKNEVLTPNEGHAGKKKWLTVIAVSILLGTAVYIFHEALGRIFSPTEFHGWIVGSLAILATTGNLYAHHTIDKVNGCEHDGLHRANIAHLITDAAISFSVFVSAVGNIVFGFPGIDAWISILVGTWMIILGKRILFDKHH